MEDDCCGAFTLPSMLGALPRLVFTIVVLSVVHAAHPLDVGDVFWISLLARDAARHDAIEHVLEGFPFLEHCQLAPDRDAVDRALALLQGRLGAALLESKLRVQWGFRLALVHFALHVTRRVEI